MGRAHADSLLKRGEETAIILGSVICWATAFPAIRVAVGSFNAVSISELRFLVGSLAFGLISVIWRMPRPSHHDLVKLAAVGLLIFVAYSLGLNFGEQRVNAGTASILVATIPVFTAITATAIGGDRLRSIGWVGVILGFIGVIAVTGLTPFARSAPVGYIFAILGSAAAEALAIAILQKPLLERYGPIAVTAYAIWFATVVLLPTVPSTVLQLQQATPQAIAAVLYLGLVPTVIGYGLWGLILKQLSPTQASSTIYLVPVAASLIGWLWLGETPTLLTALGGVLILGGVRLTMHGHLSAAGVPPRCE